MSKVIKPMHVGIPRRVYVTFFRSAHCARISDGSPRYCSDKDEDSVSGVWKALVSCLQDAIPLSRSLTRASSARALRRLAAIIAAPALYCPQQTATGTVRMREA